MGWRGRRSNGSDRRGQFASGRLRARVLALALMAPLLGGCDTLSGFFGPKDEPELDEPADKLYNEGLYLLNEKKAIKGAAKKSDEADRRHPNSEWAPQAPNSPA